MIPYELLLLKQVLIMPTATRRVTAVTDGTPQAGGKVFSIRKTLFSRSDSLLEFFGFRNNKSDLTYFKI